MEILSRLLRDLPSSPGFSYHPKCVKLHLTHLVFVDDLLVFTRGDLPSFTAVATSLDKFVGLSRLTTNPLKTCMYFGGIPRFLRELIMEITGISEGDFPFRYLGLPLSTSRFTEAMFQPMLTRIRAKIMHWANHSLSYSGKATLINSVVFGIQNFWGASILLPKGIVKKIQKICKHFYWGISEGKRRMVFQGWHGLCKPKREGGLDIKEVLSWNKCQMVRWVWKLQYKPDCLWTSWFRHYVLKGLTIWQATSTISHSWFWKSIIQVKDYLVQLVGSVNRAEELLASCSLLGLGRTIHDPAVLPKHAVIGAMGCSNKLPTGDNLKSRGMIMANRCVLCEAAEEDVHHLFFDCSYSLQVWTVVRGRMCILDPDSNLVHLLKWLRERNTGRARDKVKTRVAFVCTLYTIWKERNKRIFKGQSTSAHTLSSRICYDITTRMYHHMDACGLAGLAL
ncbi:uncharacterized protein LOC141640852 [Silene latifolia]|uniref:uncharacterized protein LOC141640852 n=1 Tax=Silene latifolia TaxID=37657 RepID=UPI003D77869F